MKGSALRDAEVVAPPAKVVARPPWIYFVRHGESVNNTLMAELHHDRKAFELKRQEDAPLTAAGEMQVDAVGRRMQDEIAKDCGGVAGGERLHHPPHEKEEGDGILIVTSYFHRALKTAAAIQKYLPNARVEVWRDVHEVGGHYRRLPGPLMGHHHDDGSGAATSTPHYVASAGRSATAVADEFPHFAIVHHPSLMPAAHAHRRACRRWQSDRGWYAGHETKETIAEASCRAIWLKDELQRLSVASGAIGALGGVSINLPTQQLRCNCSDADDVTAHNLRAIVVITHGDFFRLFIDSLLAKPPSPGNNNTTQLSSPTGIQVDPLRECIEPSPTAVTTAAAVEAILPVANGNGFRLLHGSTAVGRSGDLVVRNTAVSRLRFEPVEPDGHWSWGLYGFNCARHLNSIE